MADDITQQNPPTGQLFKQDPNYTMYDPNTGAPVQVHENEVLSHLSNGTLTFKHGDQLPVIAPNGQPGNIPAEDALQAFSNQGYDLESATARQKRMSDDYYASKPIQAGAEAAARGLSLGLSTPIQTKILGESPEQIEGLKENNPAIAPVGEVGGFIGGTLFGGPVKAVVKAGELTTKGLEKVFAKVATNAAEKSAMKSLAEKAVARGIGSAVEGAAISAGDVISEKALGNPDMTADNILATVEHGALFGGGLGTLVGGVDALAPLVKEKGVSLLGKNKDAFFDKSSAITKELGADDKILARYSDKNPNFKDNLVDLYERENAIKPIGGPTVKADMQRILEEKGTALDKNYQDIVDAGEKSGDKLGISRKQIFQELSTDASNNAIALEKKGLLSDSKKLFKMANEWGDAADNSVHADILDGKELRDLKKAYNDKVNYETKVSEGSIPTKQYYNAAKIVDRHIYDLADQAAATNPSIYGDLAKNLKQNNTDLSTALTAMKMAKRGESGASEQGLKNILSLFGPAKIVPKVLMKAADIGAGIARKTLILSRLERAGTEVQNKIMSGVDNFFSGTKARVAPTSVSALMSNSLSKDPETNKSPKNKNEAYNNFTTNLQQYASKPDKTAEKILKNTIRLRNVAPDTGSRVLQRSLEGINFLDSKVPRKSATPGAFDFILAKPRHHKVSSMEMSKFERYVNGVNNPMSLVADLESGKLSSETVEAVKTVYPQFYGRVVDAVTSKLAAEGDKMSYNKRLQLGLLFDIPSDESLVPQNIAALQQSFTAQGQNQPQPGSGTTGAVKPTVGGLKEVDVAQNTASDTQAFLQRRNEA